MSWQIIHLAQVPPSPWRNGGGVTHELVAWPDANNWVWRMSVAEVASNGMFSKFEGVQRWFAVLDGAGVQLTFGTDSQAKIHQLTSNSTPFCFDGSLSVDCQLLDGATQDFNLMVRRDQAESQMERVSGICKFSIKPAKVVAVYSINGTSKVRINQESCELPSNSLAWRTIQDKASVQIETLDALWMEVEL